MKIESFKEWLKQEELTETGLTRRDLLSGAIAGAMGLGFNRAMGANTPANSPGVPSPEDSIGMIPQIRNWSDKDNVFSKQGHLQELDKNFAYIRFTDSPDQVTKVPRNLLSQDDQDYLNKFEQAMVTRMQNNPQGQNNAHQQNIAEKKEFNPNFGPKPHGVKNPTPMQVYRHQVRVARDGAAQVSRGIKPSVDYIILYKYYNGMMPDPPMEQAQ